MIQARENLNMEINEKHKLKRLKEMMERCGCPDKIWSIVRSAHIFVIVFIFKKPSIEILDNSAIKGGYEGKYGLLLKPLVGTQFTTTNKPSQSQCHLKINYHTQRLEIPWRTVKKNVDCGVFAMRNMESYMGKPISKWKPSLHKENTVQQTTLEKLRQRYAYRMLTSEINMLKAKVLDLAEKYQNVEFKVHTAHAYKALQTIQKRMHLSGISLTPHLIIIVLKNEFILSDLDVVFINPHIGISLNIQHLDRLKQVLVLSHMF
uniref:Ubiquitin-like protease family profile domain-containing protein n=1 Tax=Lactuca sativa TaxID=4236 RepID=A0A9R1UC90_LACSA|nr:hypothetical protein LSAT_V11C900467910 [Lactuca sativa]